MVETLEEYSSFYLRLLFGKDNDEKEDAHIILQCIVRTKTGEELAEDLLLAFIRHKKESWQDFIEVIYEMISADKKGEVVRKLMTSRRPEAGLLLAMMKMANEKEMETLWRRAAADPSASEGILGDIIGAVGPNYPTEDELVAVRT